jgi:enoyl-CoA hydratase
MTIRTQTENGVAVITIDRQEALNALSFAMIGRIGEAIDEAAANGARALIVTGAGPKAFCAGADIGELRNRSLMEEKRGVEFGQAVFARLDDAPFPSVAVINGYAFGAGLELALACTFRLGTPNAKMGLPEIKLGLIPGYGGTQRLPRVIGEARALDMVLSGRSVGAAEAEAWGLLNRVVDGDPVEAGIGYARQFMEYSQPVLGFARAAVRRASQLSLAEGLKAEAELSTLAYRTEDAREGMAAFMSKRKAMFKDE